MNNKTNLYWAERLGDNIYKKNTKLAQKKLAKVYAQANKELQSQINKLYAEMLSDGVENVSATTLYQYDRYTNLINAIESNVQAIGKAEDKHIQLSLFDSFKDAYVGVGKGLGFSIDWAMVNPRMVEQLVFANIKNANFDDRIWKNKDKLKELLEKNLVNTIVNGADKDRAVKVLIERLDVGFNEAANLIRTETMRVINSGQSQSYQDRGYSRYTMSTELDDRTSETCENIDTSEEHEFINAIVGVNMPPLHPRCRSTIIPVIDSRAE